MALVLAANFEFAGFQKPKIHSLCPFLRKQSAWQNPDQVRTNHNARIYLKTALPYNNILYTTVDKYFLICWYLNFSLHIINFQDNQRGPMSPRLFLGAMTSSFNVFVQVLVAMDGRE